MIAHVAQAAESKGCVVLRAQATPDASLAAIAAAAVIARAFESRIEGLVVHDRRIIELAAYPHVRELRLDGRQTNELTPAGISGSVHAAYLDLRRRLRAQAETHGVAANLKVAHGDPLEVLVRACAASGPWNVIALAEPIGTRHARVLSDILTKVRDATGLVVVGPNAKHEAPRAGARVAVVIEEIEHMSAMARAARVIAPVIGAGIDLLVTAEAPDRLQWLEAEARRFAADYPLAQFDTVAVPALAPSDIAEALRRRSPGFVMARFAGLAVPSDDLGPLCAGLTCPLFLLR